MLKNRMTVGAALALAAAAGVAHGQCANFQITQGAGTVPSATVDVGNHGDDQVTNVALPFGVTIYGNTYFAVNVSSNGNLQFTTTNNAWGNNCFPSATFAGPTIAVLWDDQRTDAAGSGIFSETAGTPGAQTFDLVWRSTYFDGRGAVNYGIRFYEGQSKFTLFYGANAMGTSGTVGVQSGGAGGSFDLLHCNGAGAYPIADGVTYTVECNLTNPSGTGAATPSRVMQGGTALLTVTAMGAQTPPSTGLAVTGDLSGVGGSATQQFYDDGTHGDVSAGDSVFSYAAVMNNGGAFAIPFTVTDAQSRSSTGMINVNVMTVVDMGALPEAMTSVTPFDLAAGEVRWFRFTIPDVNGFNRQYLDIYSTSGGDTELGLYREDGTVVAFDDDGDAGALSQLSFGLTDPARPGHGADGFEFDGWGGDLAAGTYFLAAGRFNTTFNATNFDATSTGPAATGYGIDLVRGTFDQPYLVDATASGAVGTSVLTTIQSFPGQNPTSTSLSVVADMSLIGGSFTQAMYDDGTHGDASAGDGVFSYLAVIPHEPTQSAGTYVLPVTVTDNLSRTGSGEITVTLTAEPRGGCCINGSCQVLTAFSCGQSGGTYNGDGSDCSGTPGVAYQAGEALPASIPDSVNGAPGVLTLSVAVPPGSGTITSLGITLGVNHTWVGDLIGTISNGFTSVDFLVRPGVPAVSTVGYADNLVGEYRFTDGASVTLESICTNNSGNNLAPGAYIPTNPLAAFAGQPLEGTWTVTISDNAGADTGTVNSLSIYNIEPTTCGPSCPGGCGPSDFNGDGDVGTDQDIEAFFACLGGNCCATCFCGGADFNGDGDVGTDQDIEAYFRVLGGGNC